MECKGAAKASETAAGEGFNRNIVECKVALLESPPVLWQVLIETLWNVKLFARISSMEVVVCFNRNIVECKEKNPDIIVDLGASFNRNIVECKDAGRKVRSSFTLVLIETLWNVKTADGRTERWEIA